MARVALQGVGVSFPVYYAGTRSLLRQIWRREWRHGTGGDRPMCRVALEDVDATVSPGEVVLLCGPGGGGKLTLLRVMGGVLPVGRGQVDIQARRVGCIFAPALFHRRQSVRDTVVLEGLRYGLRPRAAVERMPEILAFARLDVDPAQDAASLVATDFLKLTLACAVEFGCDLLLVGSMIEAVEPDVLPRTLAALRAADPASILILETTDHRLLPPLGGRRIHVEGGRLVPVPEDESQPGRS